MYIAFGKSFPSGDGLRNYPRGGISFDRDEPDSRSSLNELSSQYGLFVQERASTMQSRSRVYGMC